MKTFSMCFAVSRRTDYCALRQGNHFVAFVLARSQNFEKRLLASSCLSVCPHVTTRLPLDGFSLNLIFKYVSKIYREN